ncbi:MAG: winged helix-turn-helix domain-containing protein [Alphaproteobacteria bacterium]|nr:winged helix-turn-helix domain-containing protein [Alphaproteobacteria bacterium]
MTEGSPTLVLSTGVVDWATRELRRDDVAVARLTAIEARLLRFLADHPERNIDSADLLGEVWGYRDGVRSRTVVVTMHRLRTKVERDPASPVHLLSVQGGGYRFVPLGRVSRTEGSTNLPPTTGTLVGRRAELAAVEASLAAGTVVSLVGPAGVGKTRLASEVARRQVGRLVGGVWWVGVRPARSVADVLALMRGALGMAPADTLDPEAASGPVAWTLRERGPALVVLDNAESCMAAVRETLALLVAGTPDTAWLVTSRAPVGADLRHGLEPLDEGDATTLLQLRAPSAGDDLEGLRRLATRLDGLPLALELAARWLPALGTDGVLALLDDRLRLLSGDAQRLGLEEALDLSWEVLDTDGRSALAALAWFPDRFDLDAAMAVLAQLPLEGFGPDVLRSLVDESLLAIDPSRTRRYHLLDAVRTYATAHDDRGFGERAFVAGMRAGADRARAAFWTGGEAGAMRWLRASVEALRAAIALATDPDAVADLALATLPFFVREGQPRLAEEVLARLDAVPPTDDARRWACALARLGALLDLGRVDEARGCTDRVLDEAVARPAADRIDALTRAGLVHRRLGQLDRAEAELLEAVQYAEALVDHPRAARALIELGVAQRQLRTAEAALATLERARLEARRCGDPRTEALAIGTTGLLHQRAGRRDQALGDLREARRLSEALEDRQAVEILDNNIAGILVLRGEVDAARETYGTLVETLRQRGSLRSLAFAQTNRGILLNRVGDTRGGEASLREALACFERLGLNRGIGACHCQIARMRLASGDYRSAVRHCEAALGASGQEGSIRSQARIMALMAHAACDEPVDAGLLADEVPREVEGLVALARRWVAEPSARPEIQRVLLAGE